MFKLRLIVLLLLAVIVVLLNYKRPINQVVDINPMPVEIVFPTGPTYREVECLAKNIYFEARGEPEMGQIAVAYVAINRQKSQNFPQDLCEVIYQGPISNWFLEAHGRVVPLRDRCQFSWWCDGKSDTPIDMWAWGRAMDVAAGVINYIYEDPTEGALWYHNTEVNPSWAASMIPTTQINEHIFYRME